MKQIVRLWRSFWRSRNEAERDFLIYASIIELILCAGLLVMSILRKNWGEIIFAAFCLALWISVLTNVIRSKS